MNNPHRLKILYVITSLHSYEHLEANGLGQYFLGLLRIADVQTVIFEKTKQKLTNTDNVIYLYNPLISRFPGFIGAVLKTIVYCKWMRGRSYDLVILSGAPSKSKMIFLFPLLAPGFQYAVQMTTPSVNKQKWMRWLVDLLLKFNLLFFKHILVPPSWPFDRFYFPPAKARYYELGYQDYGFHSKNFTELHLVYVGYISARGSSRGVEKTVTGLSLFLRSNPNVNVKYDIIGKDDPATAANFKNLIVSLGLENIVSYHGFLPTEKVAEIVKQANVGVCFVPQNGQFGHTSTKTLEYLIAGLPVIGTYSEFRMKYINNENGVLHQDNPESFAEALQELYQKRFKYKPEQIRDQYVKYSIFGMIQSSFYEVLRGIVADR